MPLEIDWADILTVLGLSLLTGLTLGGALLAIALYKMGRVHVPGDGGKKTRRNRSPWGEE